MSRAGDGCVVTGRGMDDAAVADAALHERAHDGR